MHPTLQLIQEENRWETLGTYIVTPLPEMEIKLALGFKIGSFTAAAAIKKLGSF